MTGTPLVDLRRDGAIALVVLDDPPVNAMSNALLERLGGVLEEIAGDAETRAVVVTGAGDKAFAAGAKLPELAAIMRDSAAIEQHVGLTRRVLGQLSELPQPVVAAVQGSAIGGGFELALACDLAVVDESAKLGLPEVGLGLIPGAGGTQRLGRRIGLARAAELILTGRLMTAHEAHGLGAVTAVARSGRALRDARELAARLAGRPATAIQAAKRAIVRGADLRLSEGLEVEREEFVRILGSDDAREGVAAFVERREPSFTQTAPELG